MPGQTPSAEEKPFSFQIFLSKPAAAGSLGLMRCAPRTGGDVGGEPRSAPRAFAKGGPRGSAGFPGHPLFALGGLPPPGSSPCPTHSLTRRPAAAAPPPRSSAGAAHGRRPSARSAPLDRRRRARGPPPSPRAPSGSLPPSSLAPLGSRPRGKLWGRCPSGTAAPGSPRLAP